MTQKVLILTLPIFIFGCARTTIKDKSEALRLSSTTIEANDDLGLPSFAQDLSKYIKTLQKTSFKKQFFNYSNNSWTGAETIQAYEDLNTFVATNPNMDQLNQYIHEHFSWLEVYGSDDWGKVFITSYFEPLYQGSRTKTKAHSHPIYLLPKDLIQIDLEGFAKTHSQLEPYLGYINKGQPGPRTLTGRLDLKTKKVSPYYSREDIVDRDLLKNKNLEIVWLDPIDNFFLQIQGSGTIVTSKENLQVGYAGQNGHAYVPVGKFVTDVIPLKDLTMSKLVAYLKSLPYDEQAKILNLNPSYVFFQTIKTRPLTSSGTEVIDGRTIATDSFYLPKGFIGMLEFQKPDKVESPTYQTMRRLVFNQDTGGAIKGPGRVDLFWGRGSLAGDLAGNVKHEGKLWFLLPKKAQP